ncbi:Hsp20/alpha crystallin family protein [Erythrobacter sp.]|uniref:Hsp20/alpha crystallin family protein n=1 Tax=Erythrobacter sp. TaxID=1042 RepID=UPI001425DA00|nr:Hsp20/alpha crystallin family protein [Erythrobacter sp.]QIQ85691.1 MAG: Hsp20/alpha crystallin family protein [Erythrobacter sp.]
MTEHTTLPARTESEPRTEPRSDQGLAAVFGRLREEIDELFEDITVPRPVRRVLHMPGGIEFSPAIDLKDKKDHYALAIELPGLEDKDIDVEFADGVLSISGEKRAESEEKADGCLISERSYGAFRRRLSMPRDIDPERIEAKYRRGVLHVTLGKDKNAAERVRKIKVA